MALPPRAAEKAKNELRESVTRKEQALTQFHEWLDKHPFIRRCYRDDEFLVQFLRTRKYSMDQAVSTFENHFLYRKAHPQWFDVSGEKCARMKSLVKCGFCYPLMDKGADGRAIVLTNHGRLEIDEFNADDLLHIACTMFQTLIQDEETQISGISYIYNFEGISMKYVGMFSITDLVEWIKSIANAIQCRIKNIYLVNLPPFAIQLVNIAKLATTEKIRQRVILVPTMNELPNFIEKSLLPKEFGGENSEAQMIESFLTLFDSRLELLREINSYDLVACENPKESVESFRKLELD